MPMITIRRLEPETKQRLRMRAARNGRSMEAEARAILRDALATSDADDVGLGTWIARHVERVGGADLEVPAREALRDPPAFE